MRQNKKSVRRTPTSVTRISIFIEHKSQSQTAKTASTLCQINIISVFFFLKIQFCHLENVVLKKYILYTPETKGCMYHGYEKYSENQKLRLLNPKSYIINFLQLTYKYLWMKLKQKKSFPLKTELSYFCPVIKRKQHNVKFVN